MKRCLFAMYDVKKSMIESIVMKTKPLAMAEVPDLKHFLEWFTRKKI